MGAKFYFFTDPGLLDPQTDRQAFGPTGVSGGSDQFRVTDLHTSAAADMPAFAICDGLICAQKADNGTLCLILKPTEQPPFDFPFISYMIYKGIDPSSLLTGGNAGLGGTIDTSKAGVNKLVESVQKSWAANNNPGDPTRECLGLHLNPTDYPVVSDRPAFADAKPLDRLFYQGDPKFQLPLVRGGWRIGDFATTGFGIEIVVERISYRPKIALARKAENVIEVDTLAAGSDDSAAFLHWDAKEAILYFVDPCAFWGSFFVAKLRVWKSTSFDFKKLSGNAIYETVLRGTAAGATNFANRNRAYLDIRNEHGNSLNYYQADGPNIQLTLAAAADIDACEVNYYASRWPSFAIGNSNLPAVVTGDKINVRFALPKTANTRPLIYISAGYRGGFRRLKDRKRFLDRPRRADAQYLYETSITIPLADDAGVKRIFAGYHKLHDFKRPIIFDGQPVPPASPNSLAPVRANLSDYLVPFLTLDDLPVATAPMILRTFDEVFYVDAGAADGEGFVANPALAADSLNVILILVPKAHDIPAFSFGPTPPKVLWPAMSLPTGQESIFQYLAKLLPTPLEMTEVADPQSTGNKIELLRNGNPAGISQTVSQNSPSTIILSLSRSEMSNLQAAMIAKAPTYGRPMLSLVVGATHRDDVTIYVAFGLRLNFLSGAQQVVKVTQPSQIQIYRHADT